MNYRKFNGRESKVRRVTGVHFGEVIDSRYANVFDASWDREHFVLWAWAKGCGHCKLLWHRDGWAPLEYTESKENPEWAAEIETKDGRLVEVDCDTQGLPKELRTLELSPADRAKMARALVNFLQTEFVG